jgi:hypothetical protein
MLAPRLLPRNVAALRRFQDPSAEPRQVSGNPVMTRLESGIGNCFPGLECDLRNLERRFFPFLEIDIDFTAAQGLMQVTAVDLPGVLSGECQDLRPAFGWRGVQ